MALNEISRSIRLLFGPIQRCRPVVAPSMQTVLVRCGSQTATRPEPTVAENEGVNPTFVNRNPRNLEQMALALKDRGWRRSWPSRKFYHRLVFSRSNHHVKAEVFSCSSFTPVLTCSTKEWVVKRELSSTQSVAACQAVGEVLALRCVQSGINRMVYDAIPRIFWCDAIQAFRTAMLEGGVILSEPRRIYLDPEPAHYKPKFIT